MYVYSSHTEDQIKARAYPYTNRVIKQEQNPTWVHILFNLPSAKGLWQIKPV